MKLKRLLSALLATIMVVSQLPVISFAADAIDVNGSSSETIYFQYEPGGSNTTSQKAYTMPLNFWESDPADSKFNSGKTTNRAQMIIPSTYFDGDDNTKTFAKQEGKSLKKLQFILSGTYDQAAAYSKMSTITVKIGKTDKTQYGTTQTQNQYIETTWTTVFSGKPKIESYDSTHDVLVIEFTTSYEYTGGNIVIDFYNDSFSGITTALKSGKIGFDYRQYTAKKYVGHGCDTYTKNWLPKTIFTFAGPENVTLTPGNTTFTANGSAQYPDVTVYDNVNKKELGAEYYDISFSGAGTTPKAAGDYVMTLTFKNGYSGTKTVNFTINPAPDPSSATTVFFKDGSGQAGTAVEGAGQMPINLWNGGLHSQMIFSSAYFDASNSSQTFAAQSGKSITKLEFILNGKYSESARNSLKDVTVKVGTTTQVRYTTEWTKDVDHLSITEGLQTVFVGKPTITDYDSTHDKLVIEFTNPFKYNGGNIVLDFRSSGTINISPTTGSNGYYYVQFSDSSMHVGIGADTNSKDWLPFTIFTFKAEKATVVYDPNEILTASKSGTAPKSPTFEVKDADGSPIDASNYTVGFQTSTGTVLASAPTEAGDYVMTITFKGEYEDVGVKTISFTVKPWSLKDALSVIAGETLTITELPTAPALVTVNPNAQSTIMPMKLWPKANSGSSHIQMLFPAGLYGEEDGNSTIDTQNGKYLTQLAFALNGIYNKTSIGTNVTVKIGMAAMEELNNSFYTGTLTEVFYGDPAIASYDDNNSMVVIDLDTPILYTGGAIIVDITMATNGDIGYASNISYGSGFLGNKWYGTYMLAYANDRTESFLPYTKLTFKKDGVSLENCRPNQVMTYDGNTKRPVFTLMDNAEGKALVEGTDYTVSFSGTSTNPVAVGQYTMTINFIGAYEGTTAMTVGFEIKAPAEVTIQKIDPMMYNGKPQSPNLVVRTDTILKNGVDYTIIGYTSTDGKGYDSATAPTDAGKYKVTIQLTKEGSTKEAEFEITKKDVNGSWSVSSEHAVNNQSVEVHIGQNNFTYDYGTSGHSAFIAANSGTQHAQTWIEAGQLAAMQGQYLNSLTLHYEARSGYTLAGGEITVKLMQYGYSHIDRYHDTTDATTVYSSGVLTIVDNNKIVLEFAQPYLYNGGNLLVDIEGSLKTSGSGSTNLSAAICFKGVSYVGYQKGDDVLSTQNRTYNGTKSTLSPHITFGYDEGKTVPVNVTATVTVGTVEWNGSVQKPTVVVMDGDRNATLVEGTDYVLKYYQGGTEVTNPTNLGTYNVSVVFGGNYDGTISAGTFTINKLTLPTDGYNLTINSWHVGMAHKEAELTGSSVPPGATITYTYYKVTAEGTTKLDGCPTEPGSYKVVAAIIGTANYDGKDDIAKPFTIGGHEIKSTVTDPTCTEGGYTTDTCTVSGCTYNQTRVPTSANGHTYGSPVVAFSDDGTTYTVTVTCSECAEGTDGHSKTSDWMGSTLKDTTPGDCQTQSTKTYQVSGEFEGVLYEGETTVKGALGEHNYEIKYDFASDGSFCTVKRTCKHYNCKAEDTAEAIITSDVTVDPTCVTMGTTTYTATFNVDWAETQTLDVVNVRVTGHEYVLKSVEFEDDGTQYKLLLTCTVCAEGTDGHTYETKLRYSAVETTTGDCKTHSTTIYKAEGVYQYAAGGATKEVSYNATKTIEGAFGPHNFDGAEVTYDFAEDGKSCTATHNCKICGEAQTAKAEITSAVTVDPTCVTKGTTTYTATFGESWAETKTKDVVDIPELSHDYTLAITDPTCTAAGVKTYTCNCGDTYTEEIAMLGHSAGEVDVENELEATCENNGSYDEVVYCTKCDGELSREKVTIDALGHKDADLNGKCDREGCDTLVPVTLTIDENKQGIYTATITCEANTTSKLMLGNNELFSLSSRTLKIFGYQTQGTYTSGAYTVKVTVNPTQKMVTVQVTLPGGGTIIRSTNKAVDGNTYIFATEGVAADNLTKVTVSCEDISVNEYTIDGKEPGLLNSGTIYNIVTSFTDARIDRAFAWTSTYTGNMAVRYRLQGAEVWHEVEAVPAGSYGSEYFYKADISGLCPSGEKATVYEYQIGVKGSENDWSETYTFTTGSDGTTSFTFAAIGDTQSMAWADAKLAQAAIAEAMESNPAFILHTGDIAENKQGAWNPNEWNLYFKALGLTGTSVPHFATSGNHDVWNSSNSTPYLFNNHFNHPNNGVDLSGVSTGNNAMNAMLKTSNETVYSFDYGEAHVIVLNSGAMDGNNDPTVMNAQRQWLIDDLNANKHAKWTIIMFHQPVHHRLAPEGNTNYSTPALMDVIEDPQYGVDLVIQGHSHLVTRTYPMQNGKIVTKEVTDTIKRGSGVVYVTIGSTTTAHDDFYYGSSTTLVEEMMLVAVSDDQQASYATFDVSANALKVTIKQLNGLVLDEFTISGSYTDDTHTETGYEKEPTCTETGLTGGKKCSECGDILVTPEIVPAKGHTWANATCTAPKTCSVCGATEGEALGHKDENSDHNCDLCGTKLTDCADIDKNHECDICGNKLTDCADIDKNHKCDICEKVLSECADKDPADHKCDICEKVLSECVDENTDFKCDTCGEVYVNAYTDAIDIDERLNGEKTVEDRYVNIVYTGGIPFAKAANGEWGHWVGFKLTIPEAKMENIKVQAPNGKDPYVINADILDADFVYFYWNMDESKTAFYSVDWNGDGAKDLDVQLDASNAELGKCVHVDEDKDHTCDGCGEENISKCTDQDNDGDHNCDICGKVIVNEENVTKHKFDKYESKDGGWKTATCTECGATDTQYDENYEGENVEVNVPVTDGDTKIETSISVGDFGKLAGTEENEGKGLNFVSNMLNMSFDNTALKTLLLSVKNSVDGRIVETVGFIVEDKTEEEKPTKLTFDLFVAVNGEKEAHTGFGGGFATVTIPLARLGDLNGKEVKVYYNQYNDGTLEQLDMAAEDPANVWLTEVDGQKYVNFKTKHFSEYEVVAVSETPAVTAPTISVTTPANGTEISHDIVAAENGWMLTLSAADTTKTYVYLVKYTDANGVVSTKTQNTSGNYRDGDFVIPEGATAVTVESALLGDVLMDGVIDAGDVTLIRREIARNGYLTSELQRLAADVLFDSSVDAGDVTILRREIARPGYIKSQN